MISYEDFNEHKIYKYKYLQGMLMQVYVKGPRSKLFKALASRAVEYYCGMLMPKSLASKLIVDLSFKKQLDGGAHGYCSFNGKDGKYYEFDIEVVKGQTVRETLMTLAHEVVHLKQFYTGELKDGYRAASTIWKGKRVDENKVDYWDLPWEVEAYGREKGLYHRFIVGEGRDEDKAFLSSIVV